MINSLEEAIKHCEEVAKTNDKIADTFEETLKNKIACRECASEHRQLAEWLKVLKEIWDSGCCNDCRNGQCKWKPKLGQFVRFNCPHYVGVANEEVNADADT